MPLYRKKLVTREARQWTGTSASSIDISQWLEANPPEAIHPKAPFKLSPAEPPEWAEFWVAANKAFLRISPGDWVIKDEAGFYPCLAAVFAETYEPILIQ